jgi:nitrile hydratase subunit beta
MNGVHDMGGMHGMGPVELEPDEPVFHHDWERRAFALSVAGGFLGRWNLDMSRHARELMPPAEYLATSYYEHWIWGLEHRLRVAGLIDAGELEARLGGEPAPQASAAPEGVRLLRAADVPAALRAPGARVDDADQPARFAPGDQVRARNINPPGHTRLPRYARGRQGVIDRGHGVWIFPDSNAAGQGKNPQHLYCVRFSARELWGPDASPRDAVFIDLFEDYLDPA